MTIVTLVNFSELLWKSKPPRGEPYSDPVRTLDTKMFFFEVVSDQCLMDSKRWAKGLYVLYSFYVSDISSQMLDLFHNVTNKT